jgi:hypothetical protein
MKQLILILTCFFSLSALAAPQFSPLQREAVRFMIEDSGGRADTQDFVGYLKMSHLLTKNELKRFPEVIAHKGFQYVQITLDDCVYDLAIVVINPDGKAINALYIDFSERN